MDYVTRLDPRSLRAPFEVFNPGQQVRGTPLAAVEEAEGPGKVIISMGVWAATEGAVTVTYTEDELCVLAAGRIRLSDATGAVEEFSAGEGFIVKSGFQGLWDTLEAVSKWYVIYK